jgi:hypothetical protein
MSNIPEHHSEKKGKSDDCENRGVDFTITRNTISVHDFLENVGELI